MFAKLEEVERRFDELTALLGQPEVASDAARFAEVAKERARLEPTVGVFRRYRDTQAQRDEARAILEHDDDQELREMARMELAELDRALEALHRELLVLLIPKDPLDEKNIILEVRAGTGGDEASLFAADLFRMYARFAESKGWTVEILSASDGTVGGYKEVIALIKGDRVYSSLKHESGVHRVQRVPTTESQGRIHTSACTVAVLPEAEDLDVTIADQDLRIDVYRSSGPADRA